MILAGEKTVAAVATPEALAASTASDSVVVQARRGNTKSVFLGNSTAQHLELAPGESVGFATANLNDVYVRVLVANEGVSYLGVV